MKFYRKIMINGKYGSVAIPRPILDEIVNNGCTHVAIEYLNEGVLVVSPA
jgi:hypothetical protein